MAPKIAACFTVVQVVVCHLTIKMERTRTEAREVVLVCVREERKSSTLVMIRSPFLLLHAKHTAIRLTDAHHRGVFYCHRNVALIYTHKHTHGVGGQRQASIHSLYFQSSVTPVYTHTHTEGGMLQARRGQGSGWDLNNLSLLHATLSLPSSLTYSLPCSLPPLLFSQVSRPLSDFI